MPSPGERRKGSGLSFSQGHKFPYGVSILMTLCKPGHPPKATSPPTITVGGQHRNLGGRTDSLSISSCLAPLPGDSNIARVVETPWCQNQERALWLSRVCQDSAVLTWACGFSSPASCGLVCKTWGLKYLRSSRVLRTT